MKIVTDDPDWAPELYEARALAMRFVRKHGRWQRDLEMIRVAERGGLRIIFHAHRMPRLLTIDTTGKTVERVLAHRMERRRCLARRDRDLSSRPLGIPAQDAGQSATLAGTLAGDGDVHRAGLGVSGHGNDHEEHPPLQRL